MPAPYIIILNRVRRDVVEFYDVELLLQTGVKQALRVDVAGEINVLALECEPLEIEIR